MTRVSLLSGSWRYCTLFEAAWRRLLGGYEGKLSAVDALLREYLSEQDLVFHIYMENKYQQSRYWLTLYRRAYKLATRESFLDKEGKERTVEQSGDWEEITDPNVG